MSRGEQIEIVARHFDFIDRGDMGSMAELFDRDAVYERPGYSPFHGRYEILHFYKDIRPIRESRHTLDEVLDSGNQFAVQGGFEGTALDGHAFELRFSDFFEFGTDGLIARRVTYFFAPPN